MKRFRIRQAIAPLPNLILGIHYIFICSHSSIVHRLNSSQRYFTKILKLCPPSQYDLYVSESISYMHLRIKITILEKIKFICSSRLVPINLSSRTCSIVCRHSLTTYGHTLPSDHLCVKNLMDEECFIDVSQQGHVHL